MRIGAEGEVGVLLGERKQEWSVNLVVGLEGAGNVVAVVVLNKKIEGDNQSSVVGVNVCVDVDVYGVWW